MKSLKEYREDRYMTMEEFAQLLGFAEDTLYRIQRGERPRLKTMRRIAEKLGVAPSDVLEFSRSRSMIARNGTSDQDNAQSNE